MAGLIDAHTHFFSRPFFNRMALLSPLPGEVDEKLFRLAAQTGVDLPDPDVERHLGRWLAAFDAHGVDHAVTFASLPEEAPAVAEAVQLAAGRLTAFGVVNPAAPDAGAFARVLLEEHGFRGVVFFPAMHHVSAADERMSPVLDEVEAHAGVAVVHSGLLEVRLRDLMGLPREYDLRYASPLEIIPAANRYPGVTFVIPHFGAGFFRECLMTGALCPNVFVDTSSSNSWLVTQPANLTLRDVFEQALEVFGTDRMLFGTDSSTFPRGWRKEVYDAQRDVLDGMGLDASEKEAILGGNARKLIRSS